MAKMKDTHQSDTLVLGPSPPGLRIGNFRWVICGLLFLATMINYMDRQVIGLLKPQLSHDLGWTDTVYGNITAVFILAYAFGYLFGGRLMDKLGVRRGLPLSAFVWSVLAAFHGLARSVTSFTSPAPGWAYRKAATSRRRSAPSGSGSRFASTRWRPASSTAPPISARSSAR